MRFLKFLGIAILVIIAVFLITGIFVSGKVKYEKSVVINAPADLVWEQVNSLEDMNKWSPWNELDPDMEQTMTGIDGTVGAAHCWSSHVEDVGSGCQTITAIDNDKHIIQTDLKFKEPYESHANAFVKVEPHPNGSKATWGFASEIPYPWRVFNLFMNMEDLLDEDFSKGLNYLKDYSEKKTE